MCFLIPTDLMGKMMISGMQWQAEIFLKLDNPGHKKNEFSCPRKSYPKCLRDTE